MKSFRDHINEANFSGSPARSSKKYNSWLFPSEQNLKQEYDIEYKKHKIYSYGEIWPTFEDFMKSVEDAKVMDIDSALDSRISNRSRTKTKEQLISLLKSYRSWGKHRSEQTTQNLYDRIEQNKSLDMPLILHTKSGYEIMAGNTRADVAMQTIGYYRAVVIDIRDLEQ